MYKNYCVKVTGDLHIPRDLMKAINLRYPYQGVFVRVEDDKIILERAVCPRCKESMGSNGTAYNGLICSCGHTVGFKENPALAKRPV